MAESSAPVAITLRPVQEPDQLFLAALYASTRADEMALVDWPAETRQAFLRMQYDAQTGYYRQVFPDMDYRIILRDGSAIGRIIVHRAAEEIRLVDVALVPEARNVGIGTGLIGELLDEAQETHKPLRLHVETFNRARHLYIRLGFHELENNGIYSHMEWQPGAVAGG